MASLYGRLSELEIGYILKNLAEVEYHVFHGKWLVACYAVFDDKDQLMLSSKPTLIDDATGGLEQAKIEAKEDIADQLLDF